ncbi:tetratricopeptide repeat protein [Tumidithrix elongata RA019]|uniref:Tetratricopeptide repeat protein n=1 Tax=Tumidithrix elongata BACA0141 TaxID=2716417 RepID=A0AAW9PSU4_9CYAN|nr:tetratricopeptide repeat protein [Tumidithrix elongata RA019]
MTLRICSLAFVVATVFASFLPLDLPLATAQSQMLQDRKALADRAIEMGNQQLSAKQYRAAIQSYQTALEIYQDINNQYGKGYALIGLGYTYNSLGQYQKALESYQQSFSIFKQIKNIKGEGYSLTGLGIAYSGLRQYQKALESYQQYLTIAKQIGDRNSEKGVLMSLGFISNSLGEHQKAIDYYQQALEIAKQIGDRNIAGDAWISLGIAFMSLGQYQKAIDSFQNSLEVARQIADRSREGTSLNGLGDAYNRLGQYQKTIDYYQQAIGIFKQIGDRNGEASVLGNLGTVYSQLGEYKKAVDYYQQAIGIFKQIGDLKAEGKSLNNLGLVYDRIGQYQKAIDFYQQSLAIARQVGDRTEEAASLIALGLSYNNLRDYQKGIDYYQQSLSIFKQVGDRNGEGLSLGGLGNSYHKLGNHQKAIEYYQQSVAIFNQIGNRDGAGKALSGLGLAYQGLGLYQKAIEHFLQSLEIARQIGDRDGAGITLNNLGFLFVERNQPELAIIYYKQSVNLRESIRKELLGLNKEEQKSYLETISTGYIILAGLLLKQGRVIEALQVLDLLKVQELEDYLKNIKGNDRTSQGIRLLEPEKAMSSQLSAISYEQIPELNQKLANQIQQLPKSEIDKPPNYLQQLPQGTALLYPLILSDRVEIILFAANTPAIHRSVPIKKDELEKLITEFKNNLVQGRKDPSDDGFREPAKKLYDILIKPVEDDLKTAKTTTIFYAPDGKLRYVPLTALYDGKQFLIENYAVNNLIAYILTDFTPKTSKQPSVLAGAFGGKKGEKLFGQNALPASLVEVSEIGKLIENSEALIENNFSRQATEGQLPNYNILHLATHAEFKSGDPDNSFILFGNGDILRLREISELKMPNIELIVLSACETAVVKSGSGVEILGFGYQIQKAGAKSAIASLWSVSDAGTQSLMQAFYGYVKQGDRSKAAALRQAQIDLIRGKQFSHPYYWSPFILIGNGL